MALPHLFFCTEIHVQKNDVVKEHDFVSTPSVNIHFLKSTRQTHIKLRIQVSETVKIGQFCSSPFFIGTLSWIVIRQNVFEVFWIKFIYASSSSLDKNFPQKYNYGKWYFPVQQQMLCMAQISYRNRMFTIYQLLKY